MKLKIKTKSKVSRPFFFGSFDPVSFTGIKPNKKILTFGVELEIGFKECNSTGCWHKYDDIWCDKIFETILDRVGGYCTMHEDCGAIEIASAPLSFSEMKAYLDCLLNPTLPKLHKPCSDWGMHVHVSREFCKDDHLDRLLQFMLDTKNSDKKEFLELVADRSVSSSWGYLPSYANFMRKNGLDEASARDGISINTWHGTHEFRLFQTQTKAWRAKANLELVHSLVKFTKPQILGNVSVANFKNYVDERSLRYPNLWELIKDFPT